MKLKTKSELSFRLADEEANFSPLRKRKWRTFCSPVDVRWFVSLLIVSVIVTATASLRPLSNKEIGLMLRAGYSSESILREITARRVLGPLDPATRKSLLEFGANSQLISALESGTFAVSPAEAEHAKQQEAEVAARRSAEVEQELTTLHQAETQARAQPAAAPVAPGTPIIEKLKDKLVRCQDGTISHADNTALDNKKLIALYYSAHWCAPCRKFTPALVDYYNRVAASHPEFEVVFVSFDRSRFGWETYLREMKMPWLAIDFEQLAGLTGLKQLGGDSIPSLLVLDGSSHIVASSYDGEKYLGPQNALAALDKIFARNAANPIAHSR